MVTGNMVDILQSGRILLILALVRLAGIEPAHLAPEASALSPELQAQK